MDLKGPLGLVLTGGGALGSWEAGCLEGLLKGGLRFKHVLGYSSGALAGAGYFLNRMPELLERWRSIEKGRILRFSPQWSPFSLFSRDGISESVQAADDEKNAKRAAAFDFTVVTVDSQADRPAYHLFTPNGIWDGPLATRLIASSSIPVIFPPVEIDGRVFFDGGIPCGEPLSFDSLGDCKTILIVEMVRPEERGREFWNPVRVYEQQGREGALDQVDTGIASLAKLPDPPEVFRLRPSTVLDFTMLDFKDVYCAPAVEQGIRDAKTFLG